MNIKIFKKVLKVLLFPFYFLFLALPNIIDNVFFHFMIRFIKLTRPNCIFLVNPTSGKKIGPKILDILYRIGSKAEGVDIQREDYVSKVKAFLEKVKGEKVCVVVCGGDGTINSVVQAINQQLSPAENQRIVYAPMPIGTGNDMSRTLNLGAKVNINYISQFFDKLNSSKTVEKKIDWWSVTITKKGQKEVIMDRNFFLYIGVGYDAEVMASFEELRKKFSFLFKINVA